MFLQRTLALSLLLGLARAAITLGGTCGSPAPDCQPYARLFAPLYKKRDEWSRTGGITAAIAEEMRADAMKGAGAIVTISSGVAYVNLTNEGFETRLYANLLMLNDAMRRLGRKSFPDVEIMFNTADTPRGRAMWSLCHSKNDPGGNWLWPGFSALAWPEIAAAPWVLQIDRAEELAQTLPFSQRSNKMFWRGGLGPYVREILVRKFANRTDIADVAPIPPFGHLRDNLLHDPDFNISTVITRLEDFCRHKYIIHTEGNAESGRLKFHLLCGSVIISHPLKWESWESSILEEGHNVVTVDPDWNTLEETYRKLEANATWAEHIASENAKMRQLLDEDGISCYILEALRCYASVMKYAPEKPTRSWKYTDLESYLLARMKPAKWMAAVMRHDNRVP